MMWWGGFRIRQQLHSVPVVAQQPANFPPLCLLRLASVPRNCSAVPSPPLPARSLSMLPSSLYVCLTPPWGRTKGSRESANACDQVAEWLRRWTANPMGFPRVSSNLILIECFAFAGGKMFCMFYALAGIPLGLVCFQSIGESIRESSSL